ARPRSGPDPAATAAAPPGRDCPGWITTGNVGRRMGSGPLRCRTALVDQAARRLGGDTRVAAVRVGPDGQPELFVQRRPADEDDVVVADPAVLEGLDHDLHVRH